ncbi:hypothetical protein CRENBAI_001588 [Crenichthys baileyi]|uniref:Uncharacterized protein n=1 Tax=Crenichthys baileyi TaxID=28760 RepID=A0AAV9SL40_9TELE
MRTKLMLRLYRDRMLPNKGYSSPLQGVGPLGDGLASLVRTWLARSREEQAGHQGLSDESQPQAWLQAETTAPPYRVTSCASIVWSS